MAEYAIGDKVEYLGEDIPNFDEGYDLNKGRHGVVVSESLEIFDSYMNLMLSIGMVPPVAVGSKEMVQVTWEGLDPDEGGAVMFSGELKKVEA